MKIPAKEVNKGCFFFFFDLSLSSVNFLKGQYVEHTCFRVVSFANICQNSVEDKSFSVTAARSSEHIIRFDYSSRKCHLGMS